MGRITFVMPDDIEEKLRRSIVNRKGNLGKALTEGAQMWLNKNSPRRLRSNFKTNERRK